jgi:hypothetical protein
MTAAGRDHRRRRAGEAGDTVDTRRSNGLGKGHRRQDGGEPPGQQSGHRTNGSACVSCWPMWSGGLGVRSREIRGWERIRVSARGGHSLLPGSKG